jgi:hypothetical protein
MLSMSFIPSAADETPQECAQELGATAPATRLAGVPKEIRADFVMRVG